MPKKCLNRTLARRRKCDSLNSIRLATARALSDICTTLVVEENWTTVASRPVDNVLAESWSLCNIYIDSSHLQVIDFFREHFQNGRSGRTAPVSRLKYLQESRTLLDDKKVSLSDLTQQGFVSAFRVLARFKPLRTSILERTKHGSLLHKQYCWSTCFHLRWQRQSGE